VKQVSLEAKEINMKPFRGSKKTKNPALEKRDRGFNFQTVFSS
jgi:hypothetical protein